MLLYLVSGNALWVVELKARVLNVSKLINWHQKQRFDNLWNSKKSKSFSQLWLGNWLGNVVIFEQTFLHFNSDFLTSLALYKDCYFSIVYLNNRGAFKIFGQRCEPSRVTRAHCANVNLESMERWRCFPPFSSPTCFGKRSRHKLKQEVFTIEGIKREFNLGPDFDP